MTRHYGYSGGRQVFVRERGKPLLPEQSSSIELKTEICICSLS